MNEELIALALRCEQAKGPDLELDARIKVVIEGYGDWDALRDEGVAARDFGAPAYTASLDAAMTLVPDGYRLLLSEWDDETHLRASGAWQAILSKAGSRDGRMGIGFDPAFKTRCDHAHSAALALCAAAIRARAQVKS